MQSFAEFIAEGRDASLFHGTNIANAEKIIKANTIDAATLHRERLFRGTRTPYRQDNGMYSGVSLSRSLSVSQRFGDVVFELDQAKLTHNHKIVPTQYIFAHDSSGQKGARSVTSDEYKIYANEHEEFVFGPIRNLDRYLKAIWISKDHFELEDILSKKIPGYPQSKYPHVELHPKLEIYQ